MTVGDLLSTICDLILTIIIFPFKIFEWILSLKVSTLVIFSTIFLMIYRTCWISDTDQSGKRSSWDISLDDWPKIKKENK